MALDRWIALIILGIFAAYGYAAWFTMDGGLAPFMRRAAIWPSTFPKVLSILGILTALVIVLGLEKSPGKSDAVSSIEQLRKYKLGQAGLLLGLMVAYALLLRPAGFLAATTGFLVAGSFVLGERKWHIMIPVAAIATGLVWYLVQEVLGIFLRPLPAVLGV